MASSVMAFGDDPPSRVARLKYISGEVSMQPGGVNDWATATINRPMTTADRLWTDKDSRAELHLGSAALRMNGETSLTLTNLSDNTVQLELDEGILSLHVGRLRDHEIYEVDTPNMAFTLLNSGDYRFDVDSQGDVTLITVWKGKGIATGDGDAVQIESNHQVRFFSGMSLAHQTYHAPRFDGFDEWCRVRSDREGRVVSVRYVSPDVIGYEDLDEYGAWREVGSYGGVWFPTRVEAGWAPYRYGHWAWVEPWGWTWIDDAAWGFAPFHYGRWVYVGGGWAWVPGHVVARPVYAPALVVFVGGRNWSVAIGAGGGGGVAWFPLAPEEPYYPAYHVSNTYVRDVNVTNVNVTNINVTNVNVTNINYRNRRAPDAVTVVSHDAFVQSRPVNRSVIAVARDRLDQARVVGFAARVTPTRQSVLAQPTGGEARRPPERVTPREAIVRGQPAAAPVPFAAREQALAAHPGRPLDNTTMRALRTSTPNANARPFVRPAIEEQRGQAPAPALRPAREGLVVAQPERRQPSAPVATPVRQAAPRGADQRGNRPDRGKPPEERPSPSTRQKRADRPTPSTAPAPAPERQKAEPQRQQPERRPAAQQPAKERKAERDTTK